MGRAHVESLDVLKGVRHQLHRFEDVARSALAGVQTDVRRVHEWLKNTQIPALESELRKREENVNRAKTAYTEARFAPEAVRKPSYVDEQKQLKKAEALRDETAKKLQNSKKWIVQLEQQSEKLMGPLHTFSTTLTIDCPKARQRLDQMIIALEEYGGGPTAIDASPNAPTADESPAPASAPAENQP